MSVHLDQALTKDKCPICRLKRISSEKYLWNLIYGSTSDPKVHEKFLDSLGFCQEHNQLLIKIIKGRDLVSSSSVARLKGPLQVVPIYLRLPELIEVMMYLLMTCAQIFTLMDREAKNSLAEKNEKLAGLFPNKIEVSRPKAEMMLDVFGNIGMVYRVNEEDIDIDISMLNELQGKIIEITRVNPIGYDSSYIKRQLNTDEIKVMIKKKISRKVDFNMLM